MSDFSGISYESLQKALQAGIIDKKQFEALTALEAGKERFQSRDDRLLYAEDTENARFITGFSDIFVVIGIFSLLVPLNIYLYGFIGISAYLINLGLIIGLTEIFTKKRRMALPSIVLTGAFAGYFLYMLLLFVTVIILQKEAHEAERVFERYYILTIAILAITAGTLWLHYRRYRVPITVAGIASLLLAIPVVLLYGISPYFVVKYSMLLMGIFGLILFAIAMHFDLKDKTRTTTQSDIAFWLHLAAAPLIVNAAFAFAGIEFFELADSASIEKAGLFALIIFIVLALVSVLIDRRALLVSGLGGAGTAFFYLMKQANIDPQSIGYFTVITLGCVILILSIGWFPLRRAMVSNLPASWRDKLPALREKSMG